MRPRGSIENSALLGLAVATALTYSALVGAGISREQLRIEALVSEAHRVREAIHTWQAEHAAPLEAYVNAMEVGWPDAEGPDGTLGTADDCQRTLAMLAGDIDFDGTINAGEPNYLSPQHAFSNRSLVDPRLRWITNCTAVGGQQFTLFLTSFGADPACSTNPGDLAQQCPGVDVGQLVAFTTGGRILPEGTGTPSPFATGNFFVEWPLWRGAAYPAMNELYQKVLAKDYNEAVSFGIGNSTAAFSGIQLGGWTDNAVSPAVRHFADSPAKLAQWISGIDSAAPGVDVPPLSPPTATRLDGRSFAVFNRAVRYDVFDGPENLFTVSVPSPCEGGAAPRWVGSIESVQMTFGGFTNTDMAVVGLNPGNTGSVLNPTGWQVFDDGIGNIYSPEVRVGVFVVLPGFLETFSALPPADQGVCRPVVLHGEVDSADVSINQAVFDALDINSVLPDVQITRPCIQSDGITPYGVEQTIPSIPRVQLAALDNTPTPPSTVRLSVMAHCASIISGSDR